MSKRPSSSKAGPSRSSPPSRIPLDLGDRSHASPSPPASTSTSRWDPSLQELVKKEQPIKAEEPDGDSDPSDSDSDTDMVSEPDMTDVSFASGVTFSGKPEQLDALLMHMRIKSALDSDVASKPAVKAAYCASTFRGDALDWFARITENNPIVFTDYNVLEALLLEVYGESDEVKRARARAKVMALKQHDSVQEFTATLESLADQLSWPETAREAFFYQGLKQGIKDALVLRDIGDYTQLKNEAKRFEALQKVAHAGPSNNPGGRTRKKKSHAKTKCGHCGRTNHETSQCRAKHSVAMIRTEGGQDAAEWQYVTVAVEGQKRKALVDTGAQVNCIRAELVTGPTRKTDRNLYGATGVPIVTRAEAIVTMVDDIPQTLYLVPELTEEVILGSPYFNRTSDTGVMSIVTTGDPTQSGRPLRLTPKEQKACHEQLKELLSSGHIRKSNSPWKSNVLFVPKKNGNLRMVIDYRKLNEVTIRDKYPIPRADDLIDKVRGAKRYSLIDIKAAFNHIRIRPGDEQKTAFIALGKLYEYTVMPFGLTNAPAVWQRHLDEIMEQFSDWAVWYMDDILVYTSEGVDHGEKVREILTHLDENDLTIQYEKLVLNKPDIIFLGRHIYQDRVEPVMDFDTIQDWPEPTTKQELQQFLGYCNWFREFIPEFGGAASPLYSKTGSDRWEWTMADSSTMSRIKNMMIHAISTYNIDPSQELLIYTDASQVGLGAHAVQNGRPVGVLSRALSPAERNYTTTERELLAVVYAATKWRHYVEGSDKVTIKTDHAALTLALNADGTNRRINRWIEKLMAYRLQLEHVAGVINPADGPSRRPDFNGRFGEEGEPGLYSEDEHIEIFWNGYPLMDGPSVHRDVCNHQGTWCAECMNQRKTIGDYYRECESFPATTAAETPTERRSYSQQIVSTGIKSFAKISDWHITGAGAGANKVERSRWDPSLTKTGAKLFMPGFGGGGGKIEARATKAAVYKPSDPP